MAFPREHCGAVILAGGRSKRMGTCKALLMINGDTMLSRLSKQLVCFDERILSTNTPELGKDLAFRLIPDIYRDSGPAAGIHAALSAASSEALFCVPCDMPNFDPALINILLSHFTPDADAIICQDNSGRLHPLCGIYSKSALPLLEKSLKQRELRMTAIIKQLSCLILDTYLPDNIFFNMNTPEAFHLVTTEQ